ncbi:hypothetical protein AX16_010265 [Volvariella volvacea WC 439]|nr:hypothetical protein AX16_010265 [Volvariella volvacea WC 439]
MTPRPILKPPVSLDEASLSPLPFAACSYSQITTVLLVDSPQNSHHVHFPPTPTLTSLAITHSPSVYDRAPIKVGKNWCELPERGCRVYFENEYINHTEKESSSGPGVGGTVMGVGASAGTEAALASGLGISGAASGRFLCSALRLVDEMDCDGLNSNFGTVGGGDEDGNSSSASASDGLEPLLSSLTSTAAIRIRSNANASDSSLSIPSPNDSLNASSSPSSTLSISPLSLSNDGLISKSRSSNELKSASTCAGKVKSSSKKKCCASNGLGSTASSSSSSSSKRLLYRKKLLSAFQEPSLEGCLGGF